jgi:hypothetical protein
MDTGNNLKESHANFAAVIFGFNPPPPPTPSSWMDRPYLLNRKKKDEERSSESAGIAEGGSRWSQKIRRQQNAMTSCIMFPLRIDDCSRQKKVIKMCPPGNSKPSPNNALHHY